MDDIGKTRDELIAELRRLRTQLAQQPAVIHPGPAFGVQPVSFELDPSAAAVMREGDERFLTCVENLLDSFGIFSCIRDETGRITDFRIDYLNQAACRNNGMTLEEQLGRGLCELLPGHRASGLFDRYCQVVQSGKVMELESVEYEDTYGGRRIARAFDVRAVKLNDGFVASWRDVTQRKQAEDELRRSQERLRESEERFRTMADGLPLIVWVHDADGQQQFVNRTFCEFFGVTEEEMRGGRWQLLMHPEDADAYAAEFFACVRDRRPFHHEVRVRAADGEWRWIESWARPRFSASGEYLGFVGTSADVTERKRAEKALRRSERRLQRLFETNLIGILYWDMHGRIHDANDAFLRMVGYERADLEAGRIHWLEMTPPEYRHLDEHALEELRRTGVDTPYEKEFIRKDGSRVWVLAGAAMLNEVDGIAFCLNVTAQRQAMEALRQAKEEAERASKAKDEFLAALSHELRTPLAPVLMATQMLERDEALPQAVREDLQMIRRSVELETRLIDDLLDLTRISRGKLQILPSSVDVHDVLRHAARTCCDDAFTQKRLKLEHDLSAERTTVHGDAARLGQIFWNLIKNAAKFTPENGTITLRSRDLPDGMLEISVIDTGVGIDPRLLPHIFDAFEQGGTHVTRRFGGLGLGLAISRALAELHHGKIAAHSNGVGHGATFIVRLPTVANQHHAADRPAPAPAVYAGRQSGRRILLVEDHEQTARILSRLLKGAGHEIHLAGCVDEARSLAIQGVFDLVISDLGLPDGSGHDLMRELRQSIGLRGIALSGYGMEEDLQMSEEAGFAAHLIKPVNLDLLLETIQQVAGPPSA